MLPSLSSNQHLTSLNLYSACTIRKFKGAHKHEPNNYCKGILLFQFGGNQMQEPKFGFAVWIRAWEIGLQIIGEKNHTSSQILSIKGDETRSMVYDYNIIELNQISLFHRKTCWQSWPSSLGCTEWWWAVLLIMNNERISWSRCQMPLTSFFQLKVIHSSWHSQYFHDHSSPLVVGSNRNN